MLIGVIAEELLSPLAITDSTAHVADDRFWQGRIYTVGFLAAGLVDETIDGGVEVFGHTYVTQDYQGIWPDLFDDSMPEIFYNFTRRFDPVLLPGAWFDPDFFYHPNIPVVPPLAPLGRFVDTDLFYAPTFLSPISPSLVTDNDVIRSSVIRRDGDAVVLLLETFADADAIFAPLSARGLAPGVVNEHFPDGDIIYAARQAAFLLPSAFNPGDVFLAPFIYSQLNPSCVLDTDVLFGPELRTPGRMGLFVDDDVFFGSSVQFTPLAPSLLADADAFPTSFVGERPPMRPLDPVIDFEDTFFAPIVTIHQSLLPHLWPDIDTIFSVPAVILGQVIAPTVVAFDTDVFYAANLPPTLSPALYTDTDSFFTPTLIFDQALSPSWLIDADVVLAPSIAALAGFDGTLALDGPIMPSTPPLTVIYVEG